MLSINITCYTCEEQSVAAGFIDLFPCLCRLFSIDPPTARDLDDALSIQQLPGGNFRVGVHIADVAHFIR